MTEENEVVASAEVSAPEPVTLDSALATLNALDETPALDDPAATDTAEAEAEVEEADPAVASQDEDEAKPDAETDAAEFLHGNARTRLRDGSEVTIGELKKAYDEAKEYRVKQAEFDAKRQEFDAKQAQIAAQEAYFTNTIGQAKAVLQANFPPKPDYAALERGDVDIITYNEQKARYDNAVEKWRGLDNAQKAQAQKAEADRATEVKQLVAQEFELLKEKLPELKTPEGMKAFKADVLNVATKEFGFSADELAGITDHRALVAIKDAIAYRKLMAQKPKALEKAKDASPVQVQAPGRRVSVAEKQAQTVKASFEQLRKSGSMNDALAILNSLES